MFDLFAKHAQNFDVWPRDIADVPGRVSCRRDDRVETNK